jgi:Ca2+-binding EF-hand superfamily protein
MKTLFALLVCVVGAPAAWAAATESTPGTTDEARSFAELHKMAPMKVMHQIDKDNKGYVTKEEFEAFAGKLFDKMDKNHDGKVDQQEWMGAVQEAKEQKAAKKAAKAATPPDTQQ